MKNQYCSSPTPKKQFTDENTGARIVSKRLISLRTSTSHRRLWHFLVVIPAASICPLASGALDSTNGDARWSYPRTRQAIRLKVSPSANLAHCVFRRLGLSSFLVQRVAPFIYRKLPHWSSTHNWPTPFLGRVLLDIAVGSVCTPVSCTCNDCQAGVQLGMAARILMI